MYQYGDEFGKNLLKLKSTNSRQFVEYLYEYMKTKDTDEQRKCTNKIKRIIKNSFVANADIAYILGRNSSTVDRWQRKPGDGKTCATPAPVDVVPVIAKAFGVSADFLLGLEEYPEEIANDEELQQSQQGLDWFETSSPLGKFKSGIVDLLLVRDYKIEEINVVINNIDTFFYHADFIVKLSHYISKTSNYATLTTLDKDLLKNNILNTLDESPELLKENLDNLLSDNQLGDDAIKEVYLADLVQELRRML